MSELEKYKTGTISDSLDLLKVLDRVVSPELRLLTKPPSGRFVGPAKTLAVEVFRPQDPLRSPNNTPIEGVVGFLRKLEEYVTPGDVFVLGCEGEVPPLFESIGGFVAALLHKAGAAGVVTNGYVRDLDEIGALGLGLVAKGTHPAIMRGRIQPRGFGVPVWIGGVRIEEGQLLVADTDGTIAIPNDPALLDKMYTWLRNTAAMEEKAWVEVNRGDKVSEVFGRYGVL